MNPIIRVARPDELVSFVEAFQDAFGFHFDPDIAGPTEASDAIAAPVIGDNMADALRTVERDRTVVADLDGQIVGTAGAYGFEITVPGATIPASGVTAVTVRATHRRQGILRSMMTFQLDSIARLGEPIAVLTATEGSIYRRFGYGIASFGADIEIDTSGLQFPSAPTVPSPLALVDKSTFMAAAPGIYDARRRSLIGAVSRNEHWWENWQYDREWTRGGASARWYVLHHQPDGAVDGYLSYRRADDPASGRPRVLVVDDLFGLSDRTEFELWRYAIEHDLVRTVRASTRPVDDPLRWVLPDPRRYAVTSVADNLWLRIIDIVAALQGRRYGADGNVYLNVNDGFRPQTSGCYRLVVEGGVGVCERIGPRIDLDPDRRVAVGGTGQHAAGGTPLESVIDAVVDIDIADLASLYLGGVSASALARSGRIIPAADAGVINVLDHLFFAGHAPWMTTTF